MNKLYNSKVNGPSHRIIFKMQWFNVDFSFELIEQYFVLS